MHRQSLGSPSSKLAVKDEHTNAETSKRSSPPPSPSAEEDEEAKKSMRAKHSYTMAPETYIHLIPMLTLLCFLILYLSSHRPSPFDLAEFNVPADQVFSNPAGIKNGDILAIRSLKNLEHEASGRAKHQLLHRKIAHF